MDNLRKLRELKNLTVTQLAKLTGIERAQIHKYESGVHSPSVPSIMKLAGALDVEPHELLPNNSNNCTKKAG